MTSLRMPAVLIALLFSAVPAGATVPALSPTLLVDPTIGTSTTPDGSDVIDDFPGADVPFGMLQWSPDTPSQNAGGGYDYDDAAITGFSLTHLSGPGCSVFGDFSILPTLGAITNPAAAKQPFSHATETAAPGWYSVTLGNPGIDARITVTKRTGLGSFTYPASTQANLLFNVSSNQAGVRNAGFRVVGPREIAGYADAGGFCGMPDRYSVYFVARFDRPFVSYGTWKRGTLAPGSRRVDGAGSGGWVTFDTSHASTVKIQVALSFVDLAGARANLRIENPGWDLVRVRNAATAAWQRMLERIAVEGGTLRERRIFYTALYHTLLHPNVFSDANGKYRGYDGAVHRARAGHAEYANYSDWDIYRTEIPLLALIAPRETSDMMQSLVDAAQQEDGILPRWALANGPTSVMGGDSVDPVIAGAYAFGARDFDTRGALAAMVKGASDMAAAPVDGWYIERPELPEYLARGYVVNTHTTSVSPLPNGASETLEYALDDFSIAQFARNIGDAQVYRAYMPRSSNWASVFDTATGLVAPRDAEGALMTTSITDNGQSGFQEGNAAQYTWMVPQDLRDLIAGMGGETATVARLDRFFSKLNAGQGAPNAWMGNEPTLGSPWVYLSAGEPWRTQQLVRETIETLYDDTPHGLAGNDDLGTMSAWYVWSAMGLYPQNPAVRDLDIGSPLFTRVVVRVPGGPTIDVRAPQASAGSPYVQALNIDGAPWQRTWDALPLHGMLRLDFALGATPDRRWGIQPQDAPPSYATQRVAFPASTSARLEATSATQAHVAPGASSSFAFTIANADGAMPVHVTWRARVPAMLAVEPAAAGSAAVAPGASASIAMSLRASSDAAAGLYDIPISAQADNGAPLERLIAIVRVAAPNQTLPLGYIENRFNDTVTPFDPVTQALGLPIAVGTEPRDAAMSSNGRRLYVADRGAQSITAIDTASQTVIATVKVGDSPNGIALTPDGRALWVANYDDGTIQRVDTTTLTAGKPIAVGPNPKAIAITPDAATLYVCLETANDVVSYDLRTNSLGTPIAVGAQPAAIAIAPDGKRAYVANFGSDDVTPIDLVAGRALPPIPTGVSPVEVAVAPDGSVAYVSNYGSTTITPIDLATGIARAPVVVGGAPYGIAFTRDSKTAFIVLRRDNAFVRVDVATQRVGAPVVLGTSPYTIDLP